ncbi:MAG TPA: arginyltransferase [Nitrospiraceae bacterium]|nr:arginyltransferase [Nitrospiraceae bacterium]
MEQKTRASACHQDKSICPYFSDGRVCTIEYLIPGDEETRNFHKFLFRGYRRMGPIFYRNACEKCSSCLPIRLETAKFRASRSHKRTLKKNEDLRVEILSQPHITDEKIMLYERYVKSKHADDKSSSSGDAINVLLHIHYGYPDTLEMNYFSGEKLIGVGIVDAARDSLSSNYFYYDTACLNRRIGVFSILQEISLTAALGKRYYYLGFYIEENPKMSYKKQFRPNEVYEKGIWRESIVYD